VGHAALRHSPNTEVDMRVSTEHGLNLAISPYLAALRADHHNEHADEPIANPVRLACTAQSHLIRLSRLGQATPHLAQWGRCLLQPLPVGVALVFHDLCQLGQRSNCLRGSWAK
jgi:hypothetical protein